MIPRLISKSPEINGANLPKNLPKRWFPALSPSLSVQILNINVNMTVSSILTPVTLAATPVPKLLNVNAKATQKASFLSISPVSYTHL